MTQPSEGMSWIDIGMVAAALFWPVVIVVGCTISTMLMTKEERVEQRKRMLDMGRLL